MTELPPGEMLKKNTFMQRQGSMKHGQVAFQEKAAKEKEMAVAEQLAGRRDPGA